MPGKIPRTFIDTLINRIDIVDLISQYVPLKKKGANHQACCPFHQEKTPSFTVNQAKQFYYCFGCGAHGNALGFIMAHERLEFVDAVEELARRLNLEVPYESGTDHRPSPQAQRSLYDMLAGAQRLFQQTLRQTPEAIEYLKQRGLSGEIAKQFGLGFSPTGWDTLLKTLGQTDADRQLLLQAGLLIQNDQKRLYDRFRGRIMFPIRDSRGRTIGFGGRVMKSEEQPKYLNSPETPVFHKGQTLYGLYEFKQANRKPQQLLLVEGYMDVIALAQQGIDYALAALGTATTPQHLRQLFHLCDTLIFCFDGDNAGREAAWRALKVSLPLLHGEFQVRFLFLPQGEDPDSLVRKEGKAAFETRYASALTLTAFLIQQLSHALDLSTLEGRAKLMTLAQPHLQALPAGPYADMLTAELSRISQLAPEQLRKLTPLETTPEPTPTRLTLVELAIALILQNLELAHTLPTPTWTSPDPQHALLQKLLSFVHQHQPASTGALLQQWPDSETAPKLAQLAMTERPSQDAATLSAELKDILQKLSADHQRNLLETLIAKSKQQSLSTAEKQTLARLLQQNKK